LKHNRPSTIAALQKSKYFAGVAVKPQTAKPSAIRNRRPGFVPIRATFLRASVGRRTGGEVDAALIFTVPARLRKEYRSCVPAQGEIW